MEMGWPVKVYKLPTSQGASFQTGVWGGGSIQTVVFSILLETRDKGSANPHGPRS